VQVLGDAAVFTHTVVTEISTKQGPTTMRERETIVFRRDGGKWIAVHEHLSPLPESTPPERK
jgi:ketosteroid isomerase-like protein